MRWWDEVDWGGLGMCSVRVEMIGCRLVGMWWWQGWDVREGAWRLGENVWRMIWISWVYTLNGWCLGIYGDASYREEHLILAEHGRNAHFKNKWWWWWWCYYHPTLFLFLFRIIIIDWLEISSPRDWCNSKQKEEKWHHWNVLPKTQTVHYARRHFKPYCRN